MVAALLFLRKTFTNLAKVERGVSTLMKNLTTITFLIICSLARAELIPVDDSKFNLCKPYGCTYHEWYFESDPSLRYIAVGYEDGIDYSLERVGKDGKLNLLLKVNPIVKDSNNKFWWGYPWSTKDILIQKTDGKIYLYASFEHCIERDGNIIVPEWQATMPALLLSGEYGKWNLAQEQYDYQLYSLSELAVKSNIANRSISCASSAPGAQ
ncbi:hypothetical protein PVT68_08560 [Microbulbifer bruguierae]|uniref:Uncharacterized protein n=1 Tax=Microbulbifer bruguierae TaxID=3029061 RepID=A0ABY8NKU5_9GAMM|nr:hypothetical protein [Microbulbifer bruguierae]WGL18332.1 hypothetical protein PVT68_08560 [Microbulbifer bruguierae]